MVSHRNTTNLHHRMHALANQQTEAFLSKDRVRAQHLNEFIYAENALMVRRMAQVTPIEEISDAAEPLSLTEQLQQAIEANDFEAMDEINRRFAEQIEEGED